MARPLWLLILLWCAALPAQEARGSSLPNRSSVLEYTLVHPMHRIKARSADAKFILALSPDGAWKGLTASVPIASFDSGNANRDSHALEVTEGPLYPRVEFRSEWVSNDAGAVTIGGILRFHGVEKPLVVRGQLKEERGESILTGAFRLFLSDFKVPRPALLFVPVQDLLQFTYEIRFPAKEF